MPLNVFRKDKDTHDGEDSYENDSDDPEPFIIILHSFTDSVGSKHCKQEIVDDSQIPQVSEHNEASVSLLESLIIEFQRVSIHSDFWAAEVSRR